MPLRFAVAEAETLRGPAGDSFDASSRLEIDLRVGRDVLETAAGKRGVIAEPVLRDLDDVLECYGSSIVGKVLNGVEDEVSDEVVLLRGESPVLHPSFEGTVEHAHTTALTVSAVLLEGLGWDVPSAVESSLSHVERSSARTVAEPAQPKCGWRRSRGPTLQLGLRPNVPLNDAPWGCQV